jgi:Mn-dependent DtxR family transcriptional regulator
MAIGVDPEKAAEEACKIEHDIDDDTCEKIGAYYNTHMEQA